MTMDDEFVDKTPTDEEQAQWLSLLTMMQAQAASSAAQNMSDDEINTEIASARVQE